MLTEMLLFLVPHATSGSVEHGRAVCWRVVAANGAFVDFGGFVLEPY
ncbi:MAG: hypothetical protein ACOC8B_00205 [Gemmatimonadota bacterium]